MANDQDRIAALDAELRRLRAAQAQPPAEEKAPKIEEVLKSIREAAIILKAGNDPSLDAAMQNEQRLVALANLVAKLAECVMSGLGATGLFVGKLNEGLGGLYQEVEHLKQFVGAGSKEPAQATQQVPVQGQSGQQETVEVDNTGAPPGTPVVAFAGGGAPGPAPAPAGMPPEIAQIVPQGQAAPIASVVVSK